MSNFQAMTLAEIESWLNQRGRQVTPADLHSLRQDTRTGARRLAERHDRWLERQQAERLRVQKLWKLETQAWQQGYGLIVGVDEAGRGPLAGPVVASAVIFEQAIYIADVKDSKRLTAAKREALSAKIRDRALAVGVGIVDNRYIDEHNILQATQQAMLQAVQALPCIPDLALVDGNMLPSWSLRSRAVVQGDNLSFSIAAASIIAKVTRDNLMLDYDSRYPEYGFAQHKGYPSAQHYQALRQHGISPIHRQTFLRKFAAERDYAY